MKKYIFSLLFMLVPMLALAQTDLTGATVTLSSSSFEYDGTAHEPTVTGIRKGKTKYNGLTAGTDYDIAYSDNINAGTATATLTFKGDYTGSATKTFTINAKDISDEAVMNLEYTEVIYDGKAKTPSATIYYGETLFTEGTDYDLAYKDNIEGGTATVTATFKGNYTGSLSAKFQIIAYSGSCGASARWNLDKETGLLSITGTGVMDAYLNESATPWYYYKADIKKVEIAEGITRIGAYAFSGCSGLTFMTIPESVTNIGSNAFSGCTNITSLNIPEGVTSIGGNAFSGCTNITSLNIPEGVTYIGENAFLGCTGELIINCKIPSASSAKSFFNTSKFTSIIIGNSITEIEKYAFGYCSSLSSVTIPNSVTSIGEGAFLGCYIFKNSFINNSALDAETNKYWGAKFVDIRDNGFMIKDGVLIKYIGTETEITIPNSVTEIGERAFEDCTGLTSVTIGNSVTSIGNSAFYGCRGLTSVTFGSSVTSIGDWAFSYCTGLKSITIPNSVTSIGFYAFIGTAWYNNQPDGLVYAGLVAYKYKGTMPENTSIVLKEGTKGIGGSAFSSCSGLREITIPNSVKSIGGGAFYYCSGLTSVTIPNSVTSIGDEAFSYCTGLKSVTIGNSVTSIGEEAFFNCSGLTEVHISDIAAWCNISFKYYNSNPLSYAHHLYLNDKEITNLVIPEGVTEINDYAFHSCPALTSVSIPNSVTEIGSGTFRGCYIEKSKFINNSALDAETNEYWGAGITENGFCIKNGVLIKYTGTETSVTIPNSVTEIGGSAFSGCIGLTEVTIPNSVTSIRRRAFYNCTGLTSVTIPNSVTSIGEEAFFNCSGLTEVHISDIAAWCNISFGGSSGNPLYYAHQLYLNDEEITDLVIPDGIIEIKNFAFFQCTGLTSITIPNSVTSIGTHAFFQCTGLTSVTIPNSVTTIGNYAFQYCTGLTEVTIGSGVTSIGNYAFHGCSGLTSVTIPNSVTSIGSDAFYSCSGLTSITIGNSVTEIGVYAFYGCSGLKDVKVFATTPPTIDYYTFSYYIPTLHVVKGYKDTYAAAENWSYFTNIVDDLNKPFEQKCATPTIDVVDGKLVFACDTEDVEYIYNISTSDIKVVDGKEVSFPTIKVSLYATKVGYENSDVVTKDIELSKVIGIRGDVNRDGKVSIADVTTVASMLLGEE